MCRVIIIFLFYLASAAFAQDAPPISNFDEGVDREIRREDLSPQMILWAQSTAEKLDKTLTTLNTIPEQQRRNHLVQVIQDAVTEAKDTKELLLMRYMLNRALELNKLYINQPDILAINYVLKPAMNRAIDLYNAQDLPYLTANADKPQGELESPTYAQFAKSNIDIYLTAANMNQTPQATFQILRYSIIWMANDLDRSKEINSTNVNIRNELATLDDSLKTVDPLSIDPILLSHVKQVLLDSAKKIVPEKNAKSLPRSRSTSTSVPLSTVASGQEIISHRCKIKDRSLSPNDEWLISWSECRDIKIYNFSTKETIEMIDPLNLDGVEFDPKNQFAIFKYDTTNSDGQRGMSSMKVYDLNRKSFRYETTWPETLFTWDFSPDRKHFSAILSDQKIIYTDIVTGIQKLLIHNNVNLNGRAYKIKVSPNGQYTIFLTLDNLLLVFDNSSGEKLSEKKLLGLLHGKRKSFILQYFTFSHDSSKLTVTARDPSTAGQVPTLQILDLPSLNPLTKSIPIENPYITNLSSDGNYLTLGSSIFGFQENMVLNQFTDEGAQYSFSPTGQWLFKKLRHNDDTRTLFKVYNFKTFESIFSVAKLKTKPDSDLYMGDFNQTQENLFKIESSNFVEIYSISADQSVKLTHRLEVSDPTVDGYLKTSHNFQFALTKHTDNKIRIWSIPCVE